MFRKAIEAWCAPAAAALLVLGTMATSSPAAPVKCILLVHGAWVDASGWKPVYGRLTREDYDATMVQEALTSSEDDVAVTKRVLDLQTGPCILVGHSYGGSAVAEAGKDPSAVGLGEGAAHTPDLVRMYYDGAGSHTIEIAGASHSVYESRPKELAVAIEGAAQRAVK